MKKIGFTIGKFAPLHKGHQFLIETAMKEMDEFYIVVYDTDLIKNSVQERADWIKKLYPKANIIYAFNSPKQYGLDKESVNIQMNYLSKLIKDVPVTHFYSSEPYGEKVAEFLNIENRIVDKERTSFPVSASKIRTDSNSNSQYLEEFVYKEFKI
ncbi:MAG: adenylyltransferase/cytidyltransferase family protein [Clostridia bacterium]|nr:adenylyltransferase/cytidyltransferase family protein [Clostridia bacterium]